MPRPPRNHRHPDPALVHFFLQPSPTLGRTEEFRIRPADFKSRTVVAREDDDRVVLQPQLLDLIDDRPDMLIQSRDHRSVRRVRLVAFDVRPLARKFRLGKFPRVRRKRIGGRLQRHVRQRRREIQEHRLVLVLAEPLHRLCAHHVGRVMLAAHDLRPAAVEVGPLVVLPHVIRIMVVRDALTIIAKEKVEPLFDRIAARIHRPKAPLADARGRVTGALQQLRDRDRVRGDRVLPFRLNLFVVADVRVAHGKARENPAARGRTHRARRIGLRELHPVFREPIDIRRRDFRLAVTTQLADAQIVRQQKHDVRLLRIGDHGRRKQQHESNKDRFHGGACRVLRERGQDHSTTRIVEISRVGSVSSICPSPTVLNGTVP